MLSSLLAGLSNLPDIWGEGAIFAFSGMDGTTCAASQFVATFGAQPYDLLIHAPLRRALEIRPADTGKVRIASGDVLAVDTARGDLVLTYIAPGTRSSAFFPTIAPYRSTPKALLHLTTPAPTKRSSTARTTTPSHSAEERIALYWLMDSPRMKPWSGQSAACT